MKHKINPLVDCVFKALFGKETNKNLLIHFLNSVLDLEGRKTITQVTILNPFNEREHETDKLSVVDVKATDGNDHIYQIEVQRQERPSLKKRIRYTWSVVTAKQLVKAKHFDTLKPTIAIWILEKDLFPKLTELHHRLRLTDPKTTASIEEKSIIHVLELGKIKKSVTIRTELDRWLRFLREGKKLDDAELPDYMETFEMRQAMETLRDFSEKENLFELYQQRLNSHLLENTYQSAIAREKRRADEAEALVKMEKQKAEAEKQKAEAEKQKAEALRSRLLELGVDPDTL